MKARRIINMTAVAGLATLLGVGLAQAQTDTADPGPQRGQLSESDYRFAIKAARAGAEEVQLGQLAEQKGGSQAVRDFGKRMVSDHSKANDGLKGVATQKGATLPPTLSRTGRSSLDELQGLSGYDFDKKYSKDMVKDHKEDVRAFEKAANDVTDPDLRAWVQNTLPTLQEHLQMAEQMDRDVKGEKL